MDPVLFEHACNTYLSGTSQQLLGHRSADREDMESGSKCDALASKQQPSGSVIAPKKPSSSMLPPSVASSVIPRPRPNATSSNVANADSKLQSSSSSSVKTWNQFNKSNPPPVTITGVAPWAVATNRPQDTASSHATIPSVAEQKNISSTMATTLPRSRYQTNEQNFSPCQADTAKGWLDYSLSVVIYLS